jgi:hypothetical protein
MLRLAAAGVGVTSCSGWIESLAARASADPGRQRSCILLWMNGGPSQLDTFDMKPGHKNGGPYQAIETAAPGVRISEHLPKLARQMKDVAVIRSMSTKEGDHGRATYNLRTGYLPSGQIQYPALGALVAKELENPELELPNFISIAPFRQFNQAAYMSGFLGHDYSPLIVGDGNGYSGGDYESGLRVKDLDPPDGIPRSQADLRLKLLDEFDLSFVEEHPGVSPRSHRVAYERAVKLMRSESVKAFDLGQEPAALRDAYGRNQFGQGCLLARRLVERGVPFVEVTLSSVPNLQVFGWDTHTQNFDAVQKLSQVLDPAWSTLMEDLRSRGLLETTLIVWMGEFGRTPAINGSNGRDHYPNAWTTVLAGGGIKGGQAIGDTGPDGVKVQDRPVSVPDFLATVCKALGIDPRQENLSNVGRPIRIVDQAAKAITEVLA